MLNNKHSKTFFAVPVRGILLAIVLALLATGVMTSTSASAAGITAATLQAKAILKVSPGRIDQGKCTEVWVPANRVTISTCTLTLTATGQLNWAAHTYSIRPFASSNVRAWLTISPATGTIKAGQQVKVTIRTNADKATVRFLAPNNQVFREFDSD